jgi:hypothetical protein
MRANEVSIQIVVRTQCVDAMRTYVAAKASHDTLYNACQWIYCAGLGSLEPFYPSH